MHLHVVRTERTGKSYVYGRLVESYRRESDGSPAHRVIANLGRMTELDVANYRAALEASRRGQQVVVAEQPSAERATVQSPDANLRYLDVVVLLELWREWGLDALLSDVLPPGRGEHSAQVVAALTIQRCSAPGSKLYATRWFPRTALPELLGIERGVFNNTRLHRVLDALDDAGQELMRKLPRLYEQHDGAFVSLFLDVTDTWFVGHGPEAAELGKTKEGFIRRKIGIVLLCNEHGFPLRWEVVSGNEPDCRIMEDMLRSIASASWIGTAPVVVDRAMGKSAQLAAMLNTKLRFLTALTITEFDSYAPALPHSAFSTLDVEAEDEEAQTRTAAEAARRAVACGLARVYDDLFVLDLGIVERANETNSSVPSSGEALTVEAMSLCRKILDLVADGRCASYAAAGRTLGLGRGLTSKYLGLRTLSEDLQREILDGNAAAHSLAALRQIARLGDPQQQRQAFDQLAKPTARRVRTLPRSVEGPVAESIRVRAVAYFNPQRFVEQRLHARRRLARIEAFVEELNERLAGPRTRMTRDAIVAAIDRHLRREELLEAYTVQVDEAPQRDRTLYSMRLILDTAEWSRRRRYDGFTVLVAHPDLPHTATDLCKLYRAKDAVEKDFQIIKSVVMLRPVRHRLDRKVRPHVTLCMLALLLERTLGRKLRGKHTAKAALELLATCHLNRYRPEGAPQFFDITRPDAVQDGILRALRLRHLVDPQELRGRLTPR